MASAETHEPGTQETRIPCILRLRGRVKGMLAKKTSKNQITPPKAVVPQLPDVQYFEISVREGEVVLRPAVVSASGERLKAVRAKIRALGLSEKDVDDAITWTRRRRR